jgi:hypothetical protein
MNTFDFERELRCRVSAELVAAQHRNEGKRRADAMKTVTKRIARLEEHVQVTLTPRKRLSILVMRVDRKPSLEGAHLHSHALS